MGPHVVELSKAHDITLLARGDASELVALSNDRVVFQPLNIEREISPIQDFLTLLTLIKLFRRHKFDCVHSIMPKAGLLAMVAARVAGVPVRVHTFTGQVWVNKTGFRRWLLKQLDKVMVWAATDLISDGFGQADFLIDEGVVRNDQIRVLGNGSTCGVDSARFAPNESIRKKIRRKFHIADEAIVILYLGRIKRDKGVTDLCAAFEIVADLNPWVQLLVVGPDEEGLEECVNQIAIKFPERVHREEGVTQTPEHFMAASDIFCLPSYREGLNVTLLEASSMTLPTVASRIYGVTEVVIDGETGLLHEKGNVINLVAALQKMVTNRELRIRLGMAARERVAKLFSQVLVVKVMSKFYSSKLAQRDMKKAGNS